MNAYRSVEIYDLYADRIEKLEQQIKRAQAEVDNLTSRLSIADANLQQFTAQQNDLTVRVNTNLTQWYTDLNNLLQRSNESPLDSNVITNIGAVNEKIQNTILTFRQSQMSYDAEIARLTAQIRDLESHIDNSTSNVQEYIRELNWHTRSTPPLIWYKANLIITMVT